MGTHAWIRRAGILTALLSISLLPMSCSQAQPVVNQHTTSSDPVITWLQQHALPVKTTEPGGSDADLQPLESIVGNASIVGLGEETHGTHEFITMKARVVEFLITHMGFMTFIMENNWGASHLVDAYINGGQGEIGNVMQVGLFTSWQTQEYKDLIAWMRAYNANPAHTTKIHFLGMDIQGDSLDEFDAVEHYIKMVDPQQMARVQNLYAGILTDSFPNPYATYPSLDAATKQRYQDQAQQVYDLLKVHQQAYESRSSPQAFALALQNARVIVQFATYVNANTSSEGLARYIQRDAFMAENVAWLHDHLAGPSPKLIVWAHDGHIANNRSYYPAYAPQGTKNLGGFLRTWYKDSYLSIAASLSRGTFNTFRGYRVTSSTVNTPGKDTYNYTLGKVDLPIFLLDIRKAPPGPVSDWANGPHVFLLYGLGGEDLSIPGPLKEWFDVIIQIQNTTASHPI